MSWYFARDDRRKLRQVVIDLPEGNDTESKFGSLALAGQYENLMSQSWCAGYFRIDSDQGPFLLVRADGHAAKLRNRPLKAAFSFYRQPAGALFGIFVKAESPELRQASPTGHAIFECIYGMDFQETVDRARQAFAQDAIHLCFADAAANLNVEWMQPDGTFRKMSAPCCRFDRVCPVDEDCRQTLLREYQQLLAYHAGVSPRARNYQRSILELSADFPPSARPILERPKAAPDAPPSGEGRPSVWKRLFAKPQPKPVVRPDAVPLPFEDLEYAVVFARGNVQSTEPSDELLRIVEQMAGRSILEISTKLQIQMYRNSGDTIDSAGEGGAGLIAATELALKGNKDLPLRWIDGTLKSFEHRFRDSTLGQDFLVVLLYRHGMRSGAPTGHA